MRISTWDEETLFSDGDSYFRGLLHALDQARSSIEIETYIYESGVLGERVTDHLIEARKRGVRVRLIVDGYGSPGFVWQYWPKLRAAGVRIRFYRVFPWILRRLPGDPQSLWSRLIRRLRSANRGNHRKFCLIDRREMWVGSFNISDVHLSEVNGPQAWKDTGVRVVGPELKYALRAFNRAYRSWSALNWPARSPHLLLLNDSYLHKRRRRLQQMERLRRARQRIWLATPYFVPVGLVLRALLRSAKAGVDVRLILPEKTDVWFMKWLSIPVLKSLTKSGVKVFMYGSRFSHQKLFIADDWICIGSTNLNHRSFLHDLEMDVVITHETNKDAILRGYLQDQSSSRPFDESTWSHLSWWERIVGSFFLLAKYWS